MTVQGSTFKVTSVGNGAVSGTWSGTLVEATVPTNPSSGASESSASEPASSTGDWYIWGSFVDAEGTATDFGNSAADYNKPTPYGFVNGTVTTTFTDDAYVGVKNIKNNSWYMTDGWVGKVQTATLYNTDTYKFTGTDPLTATDKLFIPKGVEVTITMVYNEVADTVTLSYVTAGSTDPSDVTEPSDSGESQPSSSESQPTQPSSDSQPTQPSGDSKIDISKWTVKGLKNKTYTGKTIKQNIDVVSSDGEYADFTVRYKNNKNVGIATIIITGKALYTGTITKTFKIAKAANTITAKAVAKNVSASKLKKAKLTVKKAITVKKNKGTVSYKKVSGSKYLTISKKGVITVKKGKYKKNTVLKIKVKVTAKGNSSYNSKSKTVTVKIKVVK